jgi:hypothetical protein
MPSCHKQFLVMISNSELGSYLLCKATGIFTNFLYFYLAIFKGLKLKQFLKQLNRKKQKRKKGKSAPDRQAGPAQPATGSNTRARTRRAAQQAAKQPS